MTQSALLQPVIKNIQAFIEPEYIRTDPDSLAIYGRDWTRLYPPKPSAVVLPGHRDQVIALVRYANAQRLALVPSGGRTGLSGGAVAHRGELIVSFERMNRIINFDPVERSITCEPGVITENLQTFAHEHGLFYPVDFAARGSSQIGGNIATNAGGIKVLRYGMTRDWVAGLKVVTGTGDLLDVNRGLVKNATGYDLRHLFVGSEGTLGLIVEAALKLTQPARALHVMVLGVSSLTNLMRIFHTCRQALPLTAFEFFSDEALRYVQKKGLRRPFETQTSFYVLAEFESAADTELETALALFEQCAEAGWLDDGVIAQSQTQATELWALRENISESIAPYFPYKNDIAVRISAVPDFLMEMKALLEQEYPDFKVIWFGHIGDGNLHINILKPADLELDNFVARCQQVNELLFATVQKYGGSISAEHGVGLTKKSYLHYSRDSVELAYLKAIKRVFDPNNIMNPGKIFDMG